MGNGPGLFSDIGKKAKDLLTKDYLQDQKFSITTETDSGLVLTSGTVKKGDLLIGDVATKFKYNNVTTELKADTNSYIYTTITVDELAPGLKTVLTAGVPDKSGKLEAQYQHEHAGICSVVGLTTVPVVEFSVALGGQGFALGGEVGFDTGSNLWTKYNGGVGLSKPEFSAALLVLDKGETLKASYLHNFMEAKTTVAAEVLHRLPKSDTTFTVGSAYALDCLTTVKARLNNHGRLAALLQHEFRPKSTVTLSTEVDTKALDKNPKIGLAVVLKP